MNGRLTESEWERIAEFAETPKHQRCPEQLLPNAATETADRADAVETTQREQ